MKLLCLKLDITVVRNILDIRSFRMDESAVVAWFYVLVLRDYVWGKGHIDDEVVRKAYAGLKAVGTLRKYGRNQNMLKHARMLLIRMSSTDIDV